MKPSLPIVTATFVIAVLATACGKAKTNLAEASLAEFESHVEDFNHFTTTGVIAAPFQKAMGYVSSASLLSLSSFAVHGFDHADAEINGIKFSNPLGKAVAAIKLAQSQGEAPAASFSTLLEEHGLVPGRMTAKGLRTSRLLVDGFIHNKVPANLALRDVLDAVNTAAAVAALGALVHRVSTSKDAALALRGLDQAAPASFGLSIGSEIVEAGAVEMEHFYPAGTVLSTGETKAGSSAGSAAAGSSGASSASSSTLTHDLEIEGYIGSGEQATQTAQTLWEKSEAFFGSETHKGIRDDAGLGVGIAGVSGATYIWWKSGHTTSAANCESVFATGPNDPHYNNCLQAHRSIYTGNGGTGVATGVPKGAKARVPPGAS